MALLSQLGQRFFIQIRTDKEEYLPGDLVTGTVTLSVVEATQVDAVHIGLTGVEGEIQKERQRTSFYSKSWKSFLNLFGWDHEKCSVFFSRRYRPHEVKRTLEVGDHSFPFQLQLDTDLPGTFKLRKDANPTKDPDIAIYYLVEVKILRKDVSQADPPQTQEILVRRPFFKATTAIEVHKESNITCCCCSTGFLAASAYIYKDAYGPGERVQARLTVDNTQSKGDLRSLKFKLVRLFNCKRNGRWNSTATIVEAVIPGMKNGERFDRNVILDLPLELEPSTRTNGLECSYTIDVEFDFPCRSTMTISQPVTIYTLAAPAFSLPADPPAWSPRNHPVEIAETVETVEKSSIIAP